jgi:dTDP-4-amino-4,6-dideoxygalactose transaminase
VAPVNSVLVQHALPVFVNTDPETLQLDARKLEAAITQWTRVIVGGPPADMYTISPSSVE